MNHAIAIARRDLEEKKFIFFMAVVFAIVPFLPVLLPGFRIPGFRSDAQLSVAMVAGILAITFATAVAIGLGSTMVGSDLSAGRLSFYFSKPISPSALWFGKLITALFMVYASLAIVVIPASIFSHSLRVGEWIDLRSLIVGLVIGELALLLVTHALSTMFRARSAILLADGGAFAAAIAIGWLIAKPLVEASAPRLQHVVSTTVIGAVLVVLVLAGAWQLSRARSDRRANHLELTKFLWSAMAIVLAGAGLFVMWVVSTKPSDLTEASVYVAPRGPWLLATGRASHRMDYRPAYLVNSSTGRFYRMPFGVQPWRGFTFSSNGDAAAWAHPFDFYHFEIQVRRLIPAGAVQDTGIITSQPVQLVMSDDGSRIAFVDDGILSVNDVSSRRSLGSARLPARFEGLMFFGTPNVVRIFLNERQPLEMVVSIVEFDVRDRTLRQTGELRVRGNGLSLRPTADRSRLFVYASGQTLRDDRAFMVDARTGANRTPLSRADTVGLPDGTLATFTMSNGHVELHHLSADGAILANLDLGPAWSAYRAAANRTTALIAVQRSKPGENERSDWSSVLVDLTRNAIVRTIPNARPVYREQSFMTDPGEALSDGEIVPALDPMGRIIRVNMNTGAVTPLPR